MGQNIDLKEKFQEYLNEIEGYGLRSERLYDDLAGRPDRWEGTERIVLITRWMEAAYRQGARDMAQDTVDTLGDYATALAGIPEVVYTREAAYDAARDSLMVYYTKVLDEDRK